MYTMQADKMSLSFLSNYAVVVIQLDILQLRYNGIPKIILRRFRMKKNKFSLAVAPCYFFVPKLLKSVFCVFGMDLHTIQT